MPAIDGVELPPDILDDLCDLIESLSDQLVLEHVKYDQDIAQGYQIKLKNAKTFRTRLVRRLRRDAEIDPRLRDTLRHNEISFAMIGKLSVTLLESQAENLVILLGRPAAVAGLLLDRRPEVHRLGQKWLAQHPEPEDEKDYSDEDEDHARRHFLTACIPIEILTRELMSELTVPLSHEDEAHDDEEAYDEEEDAWDDIEPALALARADDQRNIEALEAENGKLRRELGEAKDHAKKERKLRQTVERLNAKLQTAERELRQARNRARELDGELRAARDATAARDAETEAKIAAGIRDGLASRIESWMKQPLAIERELENVSKTSRGASLVERAQAALKRQADRDRHSGNLRELRGRLQALVDAREAVRRARAEALQPLPELATLDTELHAEVGRLRSLLGDAEPLGPVASSLLARINEAAEPKALDELQRILNEISDMNLLDRRALRTLYAACSTKLARMYDAFTPSVTRRKHAVDTPGRVRNMLHDNEPFVWILDGHNVLFGLDDIFGYDVEKGVPGQDARDQLVRTVVELLRNAPRCQAAIHFDGPERSERHAAVNVAVCFSGGEGDHRADRAILAYLEYVCSHMSAMPRILVTNDRDLAEQAREFKADTMRIEEFAVLLGERA